MTLTSGGPLLTRRRPPGCTGLLDAGTAVEITDSSGTVLGSGTLDTGIAMIDSRSVYGREGYATSCAFSFTVDDDS